MTTTVASIAQAAQELLDAAEAALQTTPAGFTGETALAPGMPAFDGQCDFVNVWQSGLAHAGSFSIPTPSQFRFGRINLVTLNVTTGRCLATGRKAIPSAAEKSADAEKHMQDALALWNEIGAAIAGDDLFSAGCDQVSFQGMTAYVPQGGFAGWNLAVSLEIDGYPAGA